MNIGITGASGLIGRRVAALARERGHGVIFFTRQPERGGAGARRFTTEQAPDVTGCEAIVHLAGETVVGLWTAAKRRAIRDSRVIGTRRIVEAITKAGEPPRVLVSSSAIGIYGDTGDAVTDETAPHGPAFLAQVCEEWEAEAVKAGKAGTRVALIRTGMVLAPRGGALGAMLPIFRLGLGGKVGNGRQWVSWIHIEDEAALILAAVENQAISGPVNATAPHPVTNSDFTRELAGALRRPAIFTAPAFAVRAVLGGFSAELLESRRIVPKAATDAGFEFRFPELNGALADLLEGF